MVRVRAGCACFLAVMSLAGLLMQGSEIAQAAVAEDARQILDATGVKGGLIVHLGCGDGQLTAALHASDSFLVHALDADATNVAKARERFRSLGLLGKVTADHWTQKALPYADNLVNLIVAEDLGGGRYDAATDKYINWGDKGDRIRCRYASGVELILIDGSWPLHVEYQGTEGSVYVDDDGNIRTKPESLLRGRTFGKGYPAEGHVRAFLNCIKPRRTPVSNAEATHRSMTTCHIANMVLVLGRSLKWDPVKEEFAGDPEANRMRSRAIRAPWHA